MFVKNWTCLLLFFTLVAGRDWLNRIFKLCHPLQTAADTAKLVSWLSAVWTNLAMGMYIVNAMVNILSSEIAL